MTKYFLSVFIFFFISTSIFAQELHHRVKIDIKDKNINELAALGLEIDHGHLALGRFLENDFTDQQINKINTAGFKTEIIIHDVGSYYRDQLADGYIKMTGEDCFNNPAYTSYEAPSNFSLGSMSGFYTYQEMLDILDDMRAKYPDLISERKQISDILTHEDRPIYSVVISDNPDVSEAEPKSLYTSLHHAREGGSLIQNIFFMWHLLENYGTNDLVTELLNETELHFIPCVNPDGYLYNISTNPDGGGFWRKNRRDNGDGTFGVDLNRNYGYQWGINDIGSSPNTDDQTYRGPAPFSEPETQATKWYCEQHEFNFNFNYHTYGNLLIYPWGYNDAPTPENDYYIAISKELTKQNHYHSGTGIETVGYNVNGDSDDWMYGEEESKNKIYAMTPEVGTAGFWPPIGNIVADCQANMHSNLALAALNLNYPTVKADPAILTGDFSGTINYVVGQLGLEVGAFQVTASAISDNVTISDVADFDLEVLETESKIVSFDINPEIELGDEIIIVFSLNTNTPDNTDTIRFRYFETAISEIAVLEEFGNGDFWIADGVQWLYDSDEFTSPDFSFSDSEGNYENGVIKSIESPTVTLPDEDVIFLTFDLKVEIEVTYDYAAISMFLEDGTEIPLCGKYSSKGTQYQDTDNPIYDGEFGWVKEEIELSEYKNQLVYFSLSFASDDFVNGDGIHIDDWTISTLKEFVSTKEESLTQINVFPNPTNNIIRIDIPYNQIDLVRITNMFGQVVIESREENELNLEHFSSGIYHIMIRDKDGKKYSTMVVKE